MEHPAKGMDDGKGVALRRLESLYPEFLSAVLNGIREDAEWMEKHRKELAAARDKAKRKAVQLLEEWVSAPLEDCERAKIKEAHALSEKAAKTVPLSESLSLFNKALEAIEEARQLYLARLDEEARKQAEEEAVRRKADEEEARRKAQMEAVRKKAEDERVRLHDEKMTALRTYCLLGLTAVIVLLAFLMHWTASVLGLLASLFWPLAVRKNQTSATILGIVGYLAIPAPFIPLILRHPYLAGIPAGIVMIVWYFFSRLLAEDWGLGTKWMEEDLKRCGCVVPIFIGFFVLVCLL